jgi:hypothetical protein
MEYSLHKVAFFFKNHLLGIFIFGVLTSISAALIYEYVPDGTFGNEDVINGTIVLTDFDEYEVKYGVIFKSPPKLEFYEHNSEIIYQWGSIKVIQQDVDGFKYRVINGFSSNQKVKWLATGVKTEN